MDIISPASPMALRVTSDVDKASTVFLSHVRRTFQRHPTDYTGELVRLLDDVASVTRTIASAVPSASSELNEAAVTRSLYRALQDDGYACIILSKHTEQPLTFADDVPHGNYVICISPFDSDAASGGDPSSRAIAGTTFSVYKRRSSASLPGRGIDLKQQLSKQVAAGSCCYSSATTLVYTMGHGVYSFVLHPVTQQYFQQPTLRLSVPDASLVYCDRALLHAGTPLAHALCESVTRSRRPTYTSGCMVGDVHMVLQTGGVFVWPGAHLLCDAAPIALLMEQAGGVAVNEDGVRVLDLEVEEDHNETITLVVGSRDAVDALKLKPAPKAGNGTHMTERDEAVAEIDA